MIIYKSYKITKHLYSQTQLYDSMLFTERKIINTILNVIYKVLLSAWKKFLIPVILRSTATKNLLGYAAFVKKILRLRSGWHQGKTFVVYYKLMTLPTIILHTAHSSLIIPYHAVIINKIKVKNSKELLINNF